MCQCLGFLTEIVEVARHRQAHVVVRTSCNVLHVLTLLCAMCLSATSSKQPYKALCFQACAFLALQRTSSSRWKHVRINWRDGSSQFFFFAHMMKKHNPQQDTGAPHGRLQGQPKKVKRLLGKKRTKRTDADAGRERARHATVFSKRTKQKWRMKCMPVGWVARTDRHCSPRR